MNKKKILVLGGKQFFGGLNKHLSQNHEVRLGNPKDLFNLVRQMLWADLIWVEWGLEWSSLVGRLKPPCKTICRIHRYEVFEPALDWPAFSSFDHIFFVSENIRQSFFENLGDHRAPRNTSVLYNGIDLSEFKNVPRSPGYNLGAVAAIQFRKNIHMLAEIVARLVQFDSRYTLHIIGGVVNKDCLDSFLSACRNLGVAGHVFYDGLLPHSAVAQWLADKQYMLSTSLHEGHPVGLNEAMACGIKPVIYEYPGAGEVFPSEVLFRDVEGAVRLIRETSYDSQSYRDWVAARFDLAAQGREVDAILERIFSEPSQTSRYQFFVRLFRWIGQKARFSLPIP